MPPRTSIKKSIKNSRLVPVLFTLGVIGWGFFAIDRLTSSGNPSYNEYNVEARDYVHNSEKDNKSWKKTAEEYLGRFMDRSKNKKDDRDPETENWTIVNEETSKPVEEKETEVETPAEKQNHAYYLYYYQEADGRLKLSQIERKAKGPVNLTSVFKEIISGPSSVKNNKKMVDSFPVKPAVIGAHIKNSTLFLDLDDNFGHGISFQTAELQLEQIMKTSSQFKNISSVQLLINGEEVDSIPVDGLSIPTKFKTDRPVYLSRKQ